MQASIAINSLSINLKLDFAALRMCKGKIACVRMSISIRHVSSYGMLHTAQCSKRPAESSESTLQ